MLPRCRTIERVSERAATVDSDLMQIEARPDLLLHHLREAATALATAKQELARGMEKQAVALRQIDILAEQIAEIEGRAIASVQAGCPTAATEAADAIARLQQDLVRHRREAANLEIDTAGARSLVEQGRCRLNALRRCLEMARVQKALQRAGGYGSRASISGYGALREADATLERIMRHRASKVDARREPDVEGLVGDASVAATMARHADDVLAAIKAKAGVANHLQSNVAKRN